MLMHVIVSLIILGDALQEGELKRRPNAFIKHIKTHQKKACQVTERSSQSVPLMRFKPRKPKMKLLWTTALCTGMALAFAGPLAAMDKTLSGVEVKVDLSAFEDNNVLDYWSTLGEDITTAIAAQVTVDDTAEAPRISVEINKVAIDGDTVLPETGEFNQLEGTVTTFEGINKATTQSTEANDPDDNIGSYALRLSAVTGDLAVPEGWVVVAPSQDDFYNSLITAYATAIVERIEE